MTLAREFAKLAAERLAAAADAEPFVFDLSRHSQRTDGSWLWTYAAVVRGDRIVRRVEESHFAVLGPDGRELARLGLDGNGRAVVDCGAGPGTMSGWVQTKLDDVVSRVLAGTSRKEVSFGGKTVFAGSAHDPLPLYQEDDRSTWYLLPTRARRDTDRRETGHALATTPDGDDFPDGGLLMSLVSVDGIRLATAWVDAGGSRGHRLFGDRTDPRSWMGAAAVSTRLLLERDDVSVPLPVGCTTTVFGAGHVDGRERLHNLLGPALYGEYAEYVSDHVVYAIHGRRCDPSEYAALAVAAWVEEREGRPRRTDAADAEAWLRARIAAEMSDLTVIADHPTRRFEPLGTEFFEPTKPGGDANVLGRILLAATPDSVETVSGLLRLHASGNSPYASGAEMAVAEGLLEPQTASLEDLREMAGEAGAPGGVLEALEAVTLGEALCLCRPLLRACYRRGSWDAVEAVVGSLEYTGAQSRP